MMRERQRAGRKLVQHNTCGIDIGANVRFFSLNLLGRQIGWGSGKRAHGSDRFDHRLFFFVSK